VVDAIQLTVEPSGHLERGDSITITCEIRYGGPSPLSDQQDPTLELTLDNEPAFPAGILYYEPTVNTDNFQRKRLVIFRFFFCLC